MRSKRIAFVLIILGLFMATPALPGAIAADTFDWMKYKGTKLRFVMHKIPPANAVLAMLPDFEKKTGIEVDAEILPEAQFRQKILIQFASGKSDIDVYLTMPANDAVKYYTSGWYEPLGEYLKDPSKTEPGYDYDDFAQAAKEGCTIDGKIIGMPCGFSPAIFYFRKDLFEKYNVEIPQNFDDLEAAAKKLTLDTDGDGKTDIYGWANRGKGRVATSVFSMFLFGYGGRFLDENGNPVINSPEAVKALDLYGRLLRLYGPPGSTNFNFYEVYSLFQQGKVAMCTAGASTHRVFVDPEKSQVWDKVGYTLMPGGPNGRHSFVVVWGFSVYGGSKNKNAAWLLVQYLTDKSGMKTLLKDGGVTVARNSTWKDPDIIPIMKPKELFDLSVETVEKHGNPHWNPPAVSVTELRDALGAAIVASILGEDVKQAADKAQAEWERILKEERAEMKK